MDIEFLLDLPIITALLVVAGLILADALLGMFSAIKKGVFDIRKVPQFLATNIMPYIGGLVVLAFMARLVGQPFEYIFYAVAMAVLAKYLAEIWDKARRLYGVSL